jgi:protein-disulfide isomerase
MAKTKKTSRQTPPPGRANRTAAHKGKIGWPIIAGGVAVVVIGIAVVVAVALHGGSTSSNALAQQIDASAKKLPQQKEFTLGSATAPVELEVFEDFQCPFCVKFTAEMEPMIIDEYVATGKVRLAFRTLPILGRESESAAAASICAAKQDHQWNYGLALFSKQANAGQVDREKIDVGRFDRKALIDIAADVGLRQAEFTACLDGSDASATVKEQAARAASLGIKGTPGFAIGGVQLARVPSDAAGWRTLLDAAIAGASATPATK